jgi:hypothetical protein
MNNRNIPIRTQCQISEEILRIDTSIDEYTFLYKEFVDDIIEALMNDPKLKVDLVNAVSHSFVSIYYISCLIYEMH